MVLTVRSCLLVVVAVLVLAACGSSRPSDEPLAASVAGEPISRSLLQEYVRYAVQYYAATASVNSAVHALCRRGSVACTRLRNQVLRRLLEERVVARYAELHHIHLSAGEERAVTAQFAELRAAPTPVRALLASHRVSAQFCRRLLSTEMLVRKVERAVMPVGADRGFAYHLRQFTIPIAPGGHGVHAYQRAMDLATDGSPVPANAAIRTAWVAPTRLAVNVRAVVAAARPGEFVGPFRTSDAYLVIQVLAAAVHRYGRPAREHNETAFFRRWLDRQVRAGAARCYAPTGKVEPCP